jgi:hypothetical protein
MAKTARSGATAATAEPEPPQFFTAVAHFVSFHEGPGVPIPVAKHEVARAGHSIIDANPSMWRRLVVDWETTVSDVEDADR